MSKTQVYFLGTGTSQGIPVIGSQHPVCLSKNPKDKRLRVSVWIKTPEISIVIDCGPDFRQQMLTSGCTTIDALLFTHEHADHTAGLDDIRPFNFANGALPIYAHERVLKNLTRRFDYIFETENRYPGAPSVVSHEIKENKDFKIGNTLISPISAFHGNLPIFGFKLENFVYLTDVKTISNAEIEKIKNCEVLVINCLRNEPHQTHLNLEEALALIATITPKKTYLTHISHLFGFHDEIQQQLPENVFVAYDNLIVNL